MKPEIRFNGFSDEWVEKKLGDVADLYQPKTISSKDLTDAGVHVFGANGYIGYYSNANHLLDQVTISARGANTGHPSYVRGPVWITGNSMVVNVDDKPISKYFLYTLFLKHGFKKYVTGGAQPQLIRDVLLYVPIQLPTLPEQQKIGALFSKYDTVIGMREQKLEELNALKKGLLQQMFPKKGAKVPELRFEGFADEWEERKLGETGYFKSGIGFPVSEQGGTVGHPFYKVSDMNTKGNDIELISANNYVSDDQIRLKNWKPINILPAIVFAKVGAALLLNRKRIVEHPFLIDNNLMAYSFDKSWDMYFGKTWFDTVYLPKYAQTGALPSFNASDIERIRVLRPTLPEQQKIGQLFKHLDTSILNEQTKIAQLKAQKQGLLQRML